MVIVPLLMVRDILLELTQNGLPSLTSPAARSLRRDDVQALFGFRGQGGTFENDHENASIAYERALATFGMGPGESKTTYWIQPNARPRSSTGRVPLDEVLRDLRFATIGSREHRGMREQMLTQSQGDNWTEVAPYFLKELDMKTGTLTGVQKRALNKRDLGVGNPNVRLQDLNMWDRNSQRCFMRRSNTPTAGPLNIPWDEIVKRSNE
jgi:hypothetical protein